MTSVINTGAQTQSTDKNSQLTAQKDLLPLGLP